MTFECGACERAGTKGKRIQNSQVVFNPAIAMPGMPTIDENRLGVHVLGKLAWEFGIAYVHGPEMYPHLRREQVVTACWWLGLYGARVWRKRWGEWAAEAGNHLWYECGNVPELPTSIPLPEPQKERPND